MRKIFLTFGLLLFIIPLAFSFNFGAAPKNNYESTQQGGSAQFTILFWNTGDSSYPVSVRMKDEMPGWDIIVSPQNFILYPYNSEKSSSQEGESIEIPNFGVIKANILRVFIKTPESANPKTYEVSLIATASNIKDQISILQEKEIKLTVKVEKNPTIVEKTYNAVKLTGQKIVEQGNNVRESMTGLIALPERNGLAIFIGGFILIVAAIAIVLIKKK